MPAIAAAPNAPPNAPPCDRYDCVVVGGSFAGLAAALQLARARRPVLVIDAGMPRNRFAATSRGILGQDGRAPSDIIADARSQLLAYPSVEIVHGTAERACADGDGFRITLASGRSYRGARVTLATGIVDQLPEIPGVLERWGKSVLHCPYCHGYDFADGELGVLASSAGWFDQALLIADWGRVTLFTNGVAQPGPAQLALLGARGIKVEAGDVAAAVGDGPRLTGLELRDGRLIRLDALFLAPGARQASPLAAQLGCRLRDLPSGPVIATDAAQETSVAGVFAAGDAARAGRSGTWATADGASAGIGVHRSLIAARSSTPGSAWNSPKVPPHRPAS